jgi:hypothetical protein
VTEPVPEPRQAPPALLARVPVEPPSPELARKNVLFGVALFGAFVVLFAGTIAVAFIYLAIAG